MDRLSAYAARESESESVEERRKNEQEAAVKLLEKLRLEKEKKDSGPKTFSTEDSQANGASPQPSAGEAASAAVDGDAVETNGAVSSRKSRGIPENVKLYEVFYEQVINLVTAQNLPIQDTTALLVSLANLAL